MQVAAAGPWRIRLGLIVAALAATALVGSPGEAFAAHVACGDVITQDTTLDSDLIDCPREGIVIAADDVTLDLNGHTVDGIGGGHPADYCQTGIVSGSHWLCPRPVEPGPDRVVVRGGAVRDFDFGVQLYGSEGSTVTDLAVSGTLSGIALTESARSEITRNRLSGNEHGININSVSDIIVSHNIAHRNGAGIGGEDIEQTRFERNLFVGNDHGTNVHSVHHSVVSHNRAAGNRVGLEISDGITDNLIVDNTVMRNDNGIVVFEGGFGNRIERNRVIGNAGIPTFIGDKGLGILVDRQSHVEGNLVRANGTGILLCCSGGNTVVRNRITANEEGTVLIDEGNPNLIGWNEVSRNAGGGILMELTVYGGGGHTIEGNRVSRNGADGIFIGQGPPDAADSVIRDNLATRNADDGIDVESTAVALALNRAGWNGDLGIEAVPGVIDAGGNRAFRNRNPLQCLYVECR